jgi:PAS domain S-box-containing protein
MIGTVAPHTLCEASLLENAFRDAPVGKVFYDGAGRLLKVNRAFCKLVGREEEALLGTTIASISHPDDVAQSYEQIARLRSGAIQTYRIEKRYVRADGSQIWVAIVASLVRQDGCEPVYMAHCEDLTERRAAQQALRDSEARYRLIAENTSDVVVRSDLTGRINFIASSCEPQTGYTAEEMMGQRPMDYAFPDDLPGVRRVFMGLLNGESGKRALWRIRHKVTGELKWLESYPALLRDPETQAPIGFLDVIRDVTEPVTQRQALAAARADAEAATAVKSEFLANMSHEIRTPLTAILGFADLLARQDGLSSTHRGYVDQILGSGRGLLAVVNDVLDFSRLEAGQIDIAPCPVAPVDLVDDVLAMFALQAEEKGLVLTRRLVGEVTPYLSVDPNRLRQILVNLVGNAIKFTARGSVVIELAHEAGVLSVAVRDTGDGIAAQSVEKLFQRFSQVDGSTRRRHGGAGLGLAICRGLAEAMGGAIAVDSQVGAGACFTVRLPAPAASASARDEQDDTVFSLQGVSVLVVDDNRANRDLARALLAHFGAGVQEAEDGEAALRLASMQAFDVILMDLRMPRISGHDAAAAIRRAPGPNQFTPVLAFTAEAEFTEHEAQGLFDGVVKKPLAAIDLLTALSEAMAARKGMRTGCLV